MIPTFTVQNATLRKWAMLGSNQRPLPCSFFVAKAEGRGALRFAAGERGNRPDPFDAAFLTRWYRSEFHMTEILVVVQRFVFPVLVLVGRVLGKYGK